jgi:hypothetical protein
VTARQEEVEHGTPLKQYILRRDWLSSAGMGLDLELGGNR